jgi:hypothetical protein
MSIAVCILMAPAISISAGPLISPSSPGAISSSYYTLEDIYNRLNSGTAGTPRVFTEPTTTAGAMYTLTEIMGMAPVVDNTSGAANTDVLAGKTFWGLRSGAWGPVTGNVAAGTSFSGTAGSKVITIPDGLYSGSKTATANDTNLATENIKATITIFGVSGKTQVVDTTTSTGAANTDILKDKTAYVNGSLVTGNAAAGKGVSRTGQTQTVPYPAPTGSDGNLSQHVGVAWPNPRFTNNNNGTVTDNLTGLIWLQKANCNSTGTGVAAWSDALAFCNALKNGQCGLIDGSVAGNWRLPNRFELESLLDLAYGSLSSSDGVVALSNDAGTGMWVSGTGSSFTGVQPAYYWSSTTRTDTTADAWIVHLGHGQVFSFGKAMSYYVWPVRGGQQ